MKHFFKAIKVTDNVYWVGAIDWAIRDFHGYATSRGTTYNAFLILADKVTLIDTVKKPFKDELLARISSVIDPSKIDYIVSLHSEMDHTGCLPEVIAEVKPEKVFTSKMGVPTLNAHFHTDLNLTAVANGGSIDLGNMTLRCLDTKMLHWPESMVAYLEEDKLLFSQDAFGMHLATMERFDDEVAVDVLHDEAAKYFANILMLYAAKVKNTLKSLGETGLQFDIIAPDHGPVWRGDPGRVLAWYDAWTAQNYTRKAVVMYDTMWQSTDLMARVLAEGLREGGASVKLLPLGAAHRSDVATEILEAGALVVGSPTLNNNIFPTVADALTYLKGLRPQNLVGASFGSYGWSGESIKQMYGFLEDMGVEMVADNRVKYVPDDDTLKGCYELGLAVAKRLMEKLQT